MFVTDRFVAVDRGVNAVERAVTVGEVHATVCAA